jgi:hypothetical protein
MEMVKNSPKDCYVTVQTTIMVILERLQQVLQMEARIVSQSDRVQYNDLQSLLCATLQVGSSFGEKKTWATHSLTKPTFNVHVFS